MIKLTLDEKFGTINIMSTPNEFWTYKQMAAKFSVK